MSELYEERLAAAWQEHGGSLKALTVRWLGGDHALADDVIQETLWRLWQHRDVMTNGRGSLRGWLLVVARNLCIDKIRAQKARPMEVSAPYWSTPGHDRDRAEPRARDHADLVETAIEVNTALQALSPPHREVIERIYYRDQTLAQIAADLSIPTGTVKSRSYYALRAMQAVMKQPHEV